MPFVAKSTRLLCGLLYMALMAGLVIGLSQYRQRALAEHGTEVAQQNWQTWRSDVAQRKTGATVARRVPKSNEPPVLILMRDYFPVCLTAAIVLTSCLYATLMVAVWGALASSLPVASTQPTKTPPPDLPRLQEPSDGRS